MIRKVVDEDRCIGCGACSVVCPKNAIEMRVTERQYVARIKERLCTWCGMCESVCPMSQESYDIPVQSKWLAYAADDGVRRLASSGGVARVLVDVALKNGADSAVVTHMKGLKSETLEVGEIDIHDESMNSCYGPTKPLDKIVSGRRVVFVGLPCHILAFRRLQGIGHIHPDSIAIGLFCNHCPDFTLADELGIDGGTVRFRGDGWPGTTVVRSGSAEWSTPWKDVWKEHGKKMQHACNACLTCGLVFSEEADISLGDAWIPGYKDELGANIMLVRTTRGRELLAQADTAITKKHLSDEDFNAAFSKLAEIKEERSRDRHHHDSNSSGGLG